MLRRFARPTVLAFVLSLVPLGNAVAAAGSWFVENAGNDGNSCTAAGPTTACQTIQAAVDKASPGDTINVAAGTYPELLAGPLNISKTLTLLGAQSGVDARGRVALESIVTDSQGTFVTASNVVIDGFTHENSTNGAFTGYGIAMGVGTTGTQILNSIIQNNIIGIGLANTGATQVLIRHNSIRNNNQPGPSTGTGIYTDEFVCGATCSNFLIDENDFIGNNDAGIFISNTDIPHPLTNLDVSENLFDGNGRGVGLINTDTSTIHDNRIINNTLVGSAAIRLFDSINGLTILHNDLMTGTGRGIRISAPFFGSPSSGVVINFNNIEFFADEGLLVGVGSHTTTVDAECNWWNSSTGPTNASNLGGTGEEVVGDADFTPWLTARAPGGLCNGGLPTSGKGTGGGQVPGPANFGFNAQVRGGVSSGHFEFNEKGGPAHHCDVTLVTFVSATAIEFDVSCNTGTGHVRAEDNQKQGSGAGADKLLFTQGTTTKGGTLIRGQVTVHN